MSLLARRHPTRWRGPPPPDPSVPPRHPRALPDRTPRETEVLIQVARGLSNRGIASQLFPGEATIKTYVSNILMKLGRRDRVQAVVAAYEAGLIEPRYHG